MMKAKEQLKREYLSIEELSSEVYARINTMGTQLDPDNDKVTAYNDDYSYHYQAVATANVVVKASAGYLVGVIVGADVASSVIEISDHASDGDGNVKIYKTGDALMTANGGFIKVGCYFATGICADLTNQTHCTFIFR